MSAHDYYEGVAALHEKLDTLTMALKEAQKIISPSKDNKDLPGLIGTTPTAKQRELLGNAWIVLEPFDSAGEFASDIEGLEVLLLDVGNCPLEPEPEFQGFPVGS